MCIILPVGTRLSPMGSDLTLSSGRPDTDTDLDSSASSKKKKKHRSKDKDREKEKVSACVSDK